MALSGTTDPSAPYSYCVNMVGDDDHPENYRAFAADGTEVFSPYSGVPSPAASSAQGRLVGSWPTRCHGLIPKRYSRALGGLGTCPREEP
jgi:hypothetical protein